MQKNDVVVPKLAAIQAGTHTQQVYQAIARKLLVAERKGGRIYITRKSFDAWRANLAAKRRMRLEELRTASA